MYLVPLTWAKSQNLTPKDQILIVFWAWRDVNVGIFSVGFQISKSLFIQMAWKYANCDPNGIETAIFSKK